jgi:hypothetical protein
MLVLSDDDAVERGIADDRSDVLVSCGDVIDAVITRVALKTGADHVLAVKGNHDGSGPFPSPIIDLHLTEYAVDGVRFGGFAGAWRYKPRGNYLFEQEEVTRLMAAFPSVDVFVTHIPRARFMTGMTACIWVLRHSSAILSGQSRGSSFTATST